MILKKTISQIRTINRPTVIFFGLKTKNSMSFLGMREYFNLIGKNEVRLEGVNLSHEYSKRDFGKVMQAVYDNKSIVGGYVSVFKKEVYNGGKKLWRWTNNEASKSQSVTCFFSRNSQLMSAMLDGESSSRSLKKKDLHERFIKNKAEMLILGAGAASQSFLQSYLEKFHQKILPQKIIVTDIQKSRLESIGKIMKEYGIKKAKYELIQVKKDNKQDKIVENIKEHSVIINATGMGKDISGSPLGNDVDFPQGCLIWDFNYRGELVFLKQGLKQAYDKKLTIMDSFEYSLFLQKLITEHIFDVKISQQEYQNVLTKVLKNTSNRWLDQQKDNINMFDDNTKNILKRCIYNNNDLQEKMEGILCKLIDRNNHKVVAWESYSQTDEIEKTILVLKKSLPMINFINTRDYKLPAKLIERLITQHTYEKQQSAEDQSFGYRTILDLQELYNAKELKRDIEKSKEENLLTLVCGQLAYCDEWKDLVEKVIYSDCSKEKMIEEKIARSKQTKKSINKRYYYLDWPMLDKQKFDILPKVDFYLLASNEANFFCPKNSWKKITTHLAKMPLKPKMVYDTEVWGGQFFRKTKKITGMDNVAWVWAFLPEEMVIETIIDNKKISMPFLSLLYQNPNMFDRRLNKKKQPHIPLRYVYLDNMDGGNLSVQLHPDNEYAKIYFNEKIGQHETYLSVNNKPGAKVYLGLQAKIDEKLWEKAKKQNLDPDKYLNIFESKFGELYQIPAGTVHALGKDNLVLEISTAPYRYTFKMYDYRRPGLDGKQRPQHLQHAVNNISKYQNGASRKLPAKQEGKKVDKNLSVYNYQTLDCYPFDLQRIKLNGEITIPDNKAMQILTVIKGEGVAVIDIDGNFQELDLWESMVLPANKTKLQIVSQSNKTTELVLTRIKINFEE